MKKVVIEYRYYGETKCVEVMSIDGEDMFDPEGRDGIYFFSYQDFLENIRDYVDCEEDFTLKLVKVK